MKEQEILSKARSGKSEKIKIGSTTYVVNSYNDYFPPKIIKKKIVGLIERDIAKKL